MNFRYGLIIFWRPQLIFNQGREKRRSLMLQLLLEFHLLPRELPVRGPYSRTWGAARVRAKVFAGVPWRFVIVTRIWRVWIGHCLVRKQVNTHPQGNTACLTTVITRGIKATPCYRLCSRWGHKAFKKPRVPPLKGALLIWKGSLRAHKGLSQHSRAIPAERPGLCFTLSWDSDGTFLTFWDTDTLCCFGRPFVFYGGKISDCRTEFWKQGDLE